MDFIWFLVKMILLGYVTWFVVLLLLEILK